MASPQSSGFIRSNMERLRKSLRNSFRRRSGSGSLSEGRAEGATRSHTSDSDDANKPPLWSQDEASVRAGTCSFKVKYLGSIEVYESRGMQVCEEALKVLRSTRRRPVKAILYVSGDSLRVVDKHSKGLIVDQTIEKVSFCAPDRHHEKGFAYICRDGTTRRWLCYGFHARKNTGERLSHSVGCAFAVCLEKKQKRDREAQRILDQPPSAFSTALKSVPENQAVSDHRPNSSEKRHSAVSSFQRNSYRYASLQERLQDPQNVKPTEAPPLKATSNPHAVARPRGKSTLFERQGSLRSPVEVEGGTAGKSTRNELASDDSQFRRFNSLRLNQLPSNLARIAGTTTAFHSGSIAEEDASPSSPEGRIGQTSSVSYSLSAGPNTGSPSSGQPSSSCSPFVPVSGCDNQAVESLKQHEIGSRPRGDEWLQTTASQAKFWQQYRAVSPGESNHSDVDTATETIATASVTLQSSSSHPPTFPPPPLPSEAAVNANDIEPKCRRSVSATDCIRTWTTFDDNCNSTDAADKQTSYLDSSPRRSNVVLSNTFSATNPFIQESPAIQI